MIGPWTSSRHQRRTPWRSAPRGWNRGATAGTGHAPDPPPSSIPTVTVGPGISPGLRSRPAPHQATPPPSARGLYRRWGLTPRPEGAGKRGSLAGGRGRCQSPETLAQAQLGRGHPRPAPVSDWRGARTVQDRPSRCVRYRELCCTRLPEPRTIWVCRWGGSLIRSNASCSDPTWFGRDRSCWYLVRCTPDRAGQPQESYPWTPLVLGLFSARCSVFS
jgi:hypothetical protein